MAIMAFHTPNAGISFGPALPLCGGDSSLGQLPILPTDANKGQILLETNAFCFVRSCFLTCIFAYLWFNFHSSSTLL